MICLRDVTCFGKIESRQEGDKPILESINLTLTEQRVGVIGANGSGKSSLARLLNGLLIPSQGSVTVDGLDTRDRKSRRCIQQRVGFVFQNPDHQILLPTVEEDLAFGLKNLRLSREHIASKIDKVLIQYGIGHLRYRACHLLSGGEKQLVALAAVLITQPRYLVLDEPTTLLDQCYKRLINDIILGLSLSVILVSHDMDILPRFARVLLLEQGRLVADGPPQLIIEHYLKTCYP